ncbi:MAG TPA: sugar transferase [Phycisphaerae bacterium]|nr:sugar transferase [Phycisphaerae bacterium]
MGMAYRIVKRTSDAVLAAVALVVLALPMLVLALLIRRGSPGPAIFRQERAGRDMKPFALYKFRTMRADADPFGDSPTDGADPRLTPLGRWLRETSLDELPQLWNVLKGDMSLVGPRPLYMKQAREFTERQRRRLEVRPGLTGLAQVSGRGDLPHEEKLELDVQYVENACLWLDLNLLCRTVGHVFRRRQVYQKW